MEFIAHRVNTTKELQDIPSNCGVEIDLRDRGNDIIISHEPFQSGEKFEDYLKHYDHGTMILNIKSEGIEHRIIELLREYEMKNWFFLDSSFPMIRKLSREGERKLAIRVSEYEDISTAMAMKGNAEWVWIDCFSRFPLDKKALSLLKTSGYHACLVSPELQGRENDIQMYKEEMRKNGYVFDAVCSKIKNYEIWMSS